MTDLTTEEYPIALRKSFSRQWDLKVSLSLSFGSGHPVLWVMISYGSGSSIALL